MTSTVKLPGTTDGLGCGAAVVAGGVAGQGAVADRQRAREVEDATAGVGGVAGQGAVADCQRASVVNAAAVEGGVAGQSAIADHQRPILVVDAAGAVADSPNTERPAGLVSTIAFDMQPTHSV